MKKMLSIFILISVFALVPAAYAGVSFQKYDCDTSGGISSFVKDYATSNGQALVALFTSFFPNFTFDNTNDLFDFSESRFGVNDFKVAIELLRAKLSVGSSPLEIVNTALHFACSEIVIKE